MIVIEKGSRIVRYDKGGVRDVGCGIRMWD